MLVLLIADRARRWIAEFTAWGCDKSCGCSEEERAKQALIAGASRSELNVAKESRGVDLEL